MEKTKNGLPEALKGLGLFPVEWQGNVAYFGEVPVSMLEQNAGQVAGLPANPRKWDDDELEQLCRSINETPDLFVGRPVLAYPFGGALIALGGNMRLAASIRNGYEVVPCVVYPEGTDVSVLREIVIKDNGAFGRWEFSFLPEWGDRDTLEGWGVALPDDWSGDVSADEYGEDFSLPSGERNSSSKMSFVLSGEQAEYIKALIAETKETDAFKNASFHDNTNSNGNALYLMLSQWDAARK